MSRRLVGAAGRGVVNAILSPEKQELLEVGDIEGLLELNRAQFGSATMEDDGDEDDESDEDEDEDEDDDESDEDEDSDEADEDGDDDAKGKRKKQDPKDVKIQELTAESKKHRLKAREHRTRAEQLAAENAELKRKLGRATKGKKDDEQDDEDEDERSDAPPARVQELERTNEDLLIRLEFMANQKHSWKNPKAALRLLDLSDVEIEDGEVVGLEDAIDQLAKDEPYLLKEAGEPKKQRRRGPTGQPTGTKRKGNPSRDKLLSKYPALRR